MCVGFAGWPGECSEGLTLVKRFCGGTGVLLCSTHAVGQSIPAHVGLVAGFVMVHLATGYVHVIHPHGGCFVSGPAAHTPASTHCQVVPP